MQLIVSGLGLAALLALALAFPLVADEKSLGTAVRSGAFSLAAVLVILLISRLITEFADALGGMVHDIVRLPAVLLYFLAAFHPGSHRQILLTPPETVMPQSLEKATSGFKSICRGQIPALSIIHCP
ncbi:hypothetical protein AALA80_16645 [Oscillospiraceae bacterium 50-60]